MFTFPKHHFDPGFIFAGFVSFHSILNVYVVDTVMKTAILHCSDSPVTASDHDRWGRVGGVNLQFQHLHT